MTRARKNKLQNLLIVLLSVTAVLLFLQNRQFSRGETPLLSTLLSPKSSTAGGDGESSAAALPLRFAAVGTYAAYGQLGTTTAGEEFSAPGTLLREAMGSAAGRQSVTEETFFSALQGGSVYFDFLTDLPAALLAKHLDCQAPPGMQTVRRLLLALEDGAVALYSSGAEGCLRYETKVSPSETAAYLSTSELGSVIFAGQLSQAEGLDPLSLLPAGDDLFLPQLSAVSCGADSALWNLLGFNPRTNSRYAESDGTQVILEGESTLRIQPGSVIRYESGSGEGKLTLGSQGAFANAEDAVEAGGAFLVQLLQSCTASTGLILRSVSPTADGWTMSFDYHVEGYPIRAGDGRAMASLTLQGSTVTALELTLRRYTVTEEASLLLPLTQALAVAQRYAGAELSLGYLDSGDTLSAQWLAE